MSKLTARNLAQPTPKQPPLSERYSIEDVIDQLQKGEANAVPLALSWMREKCSRVRLEWHDAFAGEWACEITRSDKTIRCSDKNMSVALARCLLNWSHSWK